MPRLGPYSRPSVLAKLDRRTREARLLAEVRADLTAHVGGSPSATQRALIERAAWLSLHVAQLDAKTAAGGSMSYCDHRTYLAWNNTLTRLLRQLGTKGAAAKPVGPDGVHRRAEARRVSATADALKPQERAAWADAPSQAEMACANERALLGCPRHHFTRFREGGRGSKRSRWRCERCGGEAPGAAVRWYCYGLAHGRGERAA